MRKFWNWGSRKIRDQSTGEESTERVLFLNGTIAEESWFGDEITPEVFREELEAGAGDITVWINSPGGDCVAADKGDAVAGRAKGAAAGDGAGAGTDKGAAGGDDAGSAVKGRSCDEIRERLDFMKKFL